MNNEEKLLREKARIQAELDILEKEKTRLLNEKIARKHNREQIESQYRLECSQCYVNQKLALRVWKFLRDYNGDPSKYEQSAKAHMVYDFFEEFNRKYPGKKQPRFTEDNEQIVQ